jgi:type VI secretion system protein VasG
VSKINRTELFGRLNPMLYQALENATRFARYRGNASVEVIHWLNILLQQANADLHLIANATGMDLARLSTDLTHALERLSVQEIGFDFSSELEQLVERSWIFASLKFKSEHIRSAHLLLAMLNTPESTARLQKISTAFSCLNANDLMDNWDTWLKGSAEGEASPQNTAQSISGEHGDLLNAQGSAIDRFTKDMTQLAREGKIDPVACREDQIAQLTDILIRRRQNNPLLVGEAGVGKTAVVEGLALRIAAEQVPEALKDVSLLELDIVLMQAGASVKGEFENRLKQLIAEVQRASRPIILFIDEAHTLIGAGGSSGTGDAANILKPALARGQLRTIAATTWSEYKRHIEKDPALTRRFQIVQVQEPEESAAVDMLRAMVSQLQQHHQVLILDEAIEEAVRLSHRYIPARQLPDKAISLLDTCCARVSLSQTQVPKDLEKQRIQIEKTQALLETLEREHEQGYEHDKQIAALKASLIELRNTEQTQAERWAAEQVLVNELITKTAALSTPQQSDSIHQQREALQQLKQTLNEQQKQGRLVHFCVDGAAVAEVVADWTGIPVGRMLQDEQRAVMGLSDTLSARVLGQQQAMETISRQVRIRRAGLEDPDKPVGVFLLVGPSGVGKTETALALADSLYGGEEQLICINMSEFQEPHTISTLKGAPPGYVGYGEGGVLTEAVRRRPYSVVLLDEIEKAHPDIHEVFYQVFDKGWMEDGEGRYIDFRNTLILMTANVGDERIMQLCEDQIHLPTADEIESALRPDLRQVFPAAFLGRVKVLPYYPLSPNLFMRLVQAKLQKVANRLKARHEANLAWDDSVLAWVHERCTQAESGARIIDAVINGNVLAPLSAILLNQVEQQTGQHFQLFVDQQGLRIRND